MLQELDIRLFQLINGHGHCDWLDAFFIACQNPWWLWPPLLLLAGWLWLKGGEPGRRFVLAVAAAVVLTDLFCAQILKPLITRVRPCVALAEVRALVGIKTSWSMPSNHAANTAAAALVIGVYYPRWRAPAFLAALLVAYSRVYVGVHYPLDVLQGMAAGFLVAVPVLWIAQAIPDGFWRGPRAKKNVAG